MDAALRFEETGSRPSSVTNSAIHNGMGWAMNIKNSRNIEIQNNVIFNFRPVGIAVDVSQNVTIDGNVMGQIVERETFSVIGSQADKRGMFIVCAYLSWPQTCTNVTVTNNIAGGGTYAGFVVPGHACGASETQTVFKNNVAHSIHGFKGGHGAIIYPDINAGQSSCTGGSYFSAYKCYEQGAYSYMGTDKVEFSNMTMIDNVHGFGAGLS